MVKNKILWSILKIRWGYSPIAPPFPLPISINNESANLDFSGGQTCVNNPNVNQGGQAFISRGRQVIIPRAKFNCSGKITYVAVSMSQPDGMNLDLPLFQVWHPTSNDSNIYSKIGQVQLPAGNFVRLETRRNYFLAILPLNSSGQIEFQSGDVIGYYQPSSPQCLIGSIQTNGFASYSNIATSPSTLIDTNNVDNIENDRQPLIAVIFGKNVRIIIAKLIYC